MKAKISSTTKNSTRLRRKQETSEETSDFLADIETEPNAIIFINMMGSKYK